MSDIKSLEAGDRKYKLVVMAPWVGAHYATKVSGLLAKALAGEAGEAKDLSDMKSEIEGGGMSEELVSRIVGMVTRILPHLDPDTFTELAREAFKNSEVTAPNGNNLSDEGLFDEWFGKHRGDYFPVAIWAIKENCSGFFVEGGEAWSALGEQFLPSESPKDG